ncbi:MAG: hypothetical protein Q4G40_08880 [Brachybacterium sp.]|nr:hypothetical protein [Brachybacterium sp.]
MTTARFGTDDGSAPAGVLAWIGTTVTVLAALVLLGQGAVASARAASAADLAALASADALAVGTADPCVRARDIAERNGATLSACTVDGEEVRVEVRVEAGLLPPARALARAGPGPLPEARGQGPITGKDAAAVTGGAPSGL